MAYLDHNTTGIIVSVVVVVVIIIIIIIIIIIFIFTQPYDKFFQMSVKENFRK